MRTYQFKSPASVDEVRDLYRPLPVTNIVESLLLLEPESINREYLFSFPNLIRFTSKGDFFIMPSPAYLPESGLAAHHKASLSKRGFGLNGWFTHPALLKNSYFEKKIYRSNPSLILSAPSQEWSRLRKRTSKSILDLESETGIKYYATLLDLTPNDTQWLKEIRMITSQLLKDQFGFIEGRDDLKIYFHFPYPVETTTLHLHIRVNQKIHPMEENMRFYLDDIINHLQNNRKIHSFILEKQHKLKEKGILSTDAAEKLLSRASGLTIEKVENNYILNCGDKK